MLRTIIKVTVLTALATPVAGAGSRDIPSDIYWGLCPADEPAPVRPEFTDPKTQPGSTEISADRAQLKKEGISTFTGKVEVVHKDISLRADRVSYDDENSRVEFAGNARVWSDALYWEGEGGWLLLDSSFGRMNEGSYRILDRRGRGYAKSIAVAAEEDVSRLKGVDYTTCPGDKPTWQLFASGIRLDHEEEWGRAENVVLKIRDVPVFYAPRLTFPLSDKRKTGLLTPRFGTSSESGVDITLPYYWNIHPQFDATITPRILGDRGLNLGTELRFLTEDHEGQLNTEYLPSDDKFENRDRYLVAFRDDYWYRDQHISGALIYNYVSDKEYFEDFGGSLSLTSTRFLEQRGEIKKRGKWWTLLGRVQSYQTVDQTLASGIRPYKRLPQLLFWSALPLGFKHLNVHMQAETTYFDKEGDVSGGRIDLRPSIGFPFRTPGTFFVPTFELRHTQYLLDNNPKPEDDPARTVPVISVDSGIFLEREFLVGGNRFLSTIEPRMFYLYIPHVGQDEFPIFDTGEFDFSYRQLFREDRFSGRDRVGDANQISIGIDTQLLETKTGLERVRARIGQIFYFDDREVVLPGEEIDTDNQSEFIAELNSQITHSLSLAASLQWNPNDERTDKGSVRMRYQPANRGVVNVEYRTRQAQTDVEQTDLSFLWPLSERWSVLGRWNYSLRDAGTLEAVGGFEYNSCCWAMRAAVRRFLRNVDTLADESRDREFDTAILLQFELKGLTGLGRGTASFLEKTIPGYIENF